MGADEAIRKLKERWLTGRQRSPAKSLQSPGGDGDRDRCVWYDSSRCAWELRLMPKCFKGNNNERNDKQE
jgi:hypothetical protein